MSGAPAYLISRLAVTSPDEYTAPTTLLSFAGLLSFRQAKSRYEEDIVKHDVWGKKDMKLLGCSENTPTLHAEWHSRS